MSKFAGSLPLELHHSLHNYTQQPQGQTKPNSQDLKTPSPLLGPALKPPKLPIFTLSAQCQNLSLPASTTKSIPSPALDALPRLITFAL